MGVVEVKVWNFFSSKMISFKLNFDLDLKKVCSNFKLKSRSPMIFTMSLGKDRLMYRKESELIVF
jgi:hypothetical protein